MKINLRGQVRNTKLSASHGLLPLFEAVINSIQAIEEVQSAGGGTIRITIERRPTQMVMSDGESGAMVLEPIENFRIEDNGSGFNEQNFASFETAHSRSKVAKGGKGIGRLVWLKAFEKAEVNSYFGENGKFWRRSFDFTLTDEGLLNLKLEEVEPRPSLTTVRLVGFKPEYRDKVPRQDNPIARRIIEHCLEYFVMGNAPKILLIDDQTKEQTDLTDIFNKEVLDHSESQHFKIKDETFHITHVQVATTQDTVHRLNFCAHKRTVKPENLVSKIPNLTPSLRDASKDRSFVYCGYVSSPYLDETVSAERTGFDIPDEGELRGDADLSWSEIVEDGLSQATKFLEQYTQPVKVAKEEQIEQYVHHSAPQFRHLLKHRRQALDTIPPNLPDDKLDIELYRIDQEYQHEMQLRYKELLSASDPKAMEQQEYEKTLEAFIEEWNELGMSKLARHVVHRKATLSFLESRRDLQQGTGKYLLEDAVHKVIFPLRSTSDDVPPDRMNLWILDEKLAYHYYLASDKRFTQMREVVESDSIDRPDIIIFNNPAAFVDSSAPFQSIVLIEFKRPARDDYDDEENPITQVYDYVRRLKSANAKDRKGRPITISPTTPIYAHIVCDLTHTLQEQAENARLTKTPDSHGYYGYNDILGVYVEIVSFDKLIEDAKRRNAVLFEQLGLGADVKVELT
jgi:hypothetical protein